MYKTMCGVSLDVLAAVGFYRVCSPDDGHDDARNMSRSN